MPEYLDDNGNPQYLDDTGNPVSTLDNPENRSFLSNFHPIEDLSSAGGGLLDFGKGLAQMGGQLMLRGPVGMTADFGNQLAGQYIANKGLQAINDPNAQSNTGFAVKQGLGAISPIPIDPFLNTLKGIGYGTGLTDTPVAPEVAARGIGETAGAAGLFLGPMAHGPMRAPLTESTRLLPASTEARTFHGGPDGGGLKEVKDFYNYQGMSGDILGSQNQVPSKVLRDIPMTKVVGPKGKTEYHFNPEDQTFTHKSTGQIFNTRGESVANPAREFGDTVIPPDILSDQPMRPSRGLDIPDDNILREDGNSYFPNEGGPPKSLEELQMAMDEGNFEFPEGKPTNPVKEARVIRQLKQETGATPAEAEGIRKLQRVFPFESTKRLHQFVKENPGILEDRTEQAEFMRVPGTAKGGGLDNIAMGGGSPRVLQVLGSSLYSNDRPSVVTKELLQNAFDEHRIAGITEPIRAHFMRQDINPQTNAPTTSVTIRDRGRGLTPEQLYTIFTDVGETGKAGIDSASGGFGFAKAAPMLSGEYVRVESIVNENGKRVKYIFEGNPKELINQAQGVPLLREEGEYTKVVNGIRITKKGTEAPTGLKVKTWFPEKDSVYSAQNLAENMTKHSPSITSPLEIIDPYADKNTVNDLLDFTPRKDINYKYDSVRHEAAPIQPLEGTIDTPGATVNLHYIATPSEKTGYELHFQNKGLHQGMTYGGYDRVPMSNLPPEIFADIISKVEEGHPDYPFAANREQLNTKITSAIDDWVKKNLIEGATKKRLAMLQRAYDEMKPISSTMVHVDQGSRFTPEEIATIRTNRGFQNALGSLQLVHQDILKTADTLGWSTSPSSKLQKFGLLWAGPDPKSGDITLGIHIPNPSSTGTQSAILINLAEHLNKAVIEGNIDRLSTGLLTTITHEQAHIPGGGHDVGFAYRHAALMEALGRKNTNAMLDRINNAFGDKNGQLKSEILDVLQLYKDSRGRTASTDDPLLGTGEHSKGQTNSTRRKTTDTERISGSREKFRRGNSIGETVDRKRSNLVEALNLPRALQASLDLSAPLRQGRAFIHKKQYWQAFDDMFKSMRSEDAFQAVQQTIMDHPLYNLAKDAGIKFTDLVDLSGREEAIMSSWAEKVPGVRASNRAYTAFLNKLRMDVFADLVEKNNLQKDLPEARVMADFINTATGRGSLGRFEKDAVELNSIMFAPRNTMSQIKLLNVFNPNHYIYASPAVRMEAIKSLAAIFGTTSVILGLGKMAGAQVSLDPTNADFGKLRIGKTRLDFNGGYGQYVVSFARMVDSLAGDSKYTSSKNKKSYPTSIPQELGRMARNKENPILSFAHSMAIGRTPTGEKFQVAPQTMQLFIPMLMQDMATLAKKQPELIPIAGPLATFGAGVQTY